MNYRDASIRGIRDFASGDQLTQLERGSTESPARSYFGDAKHRTIKPFFLITEHRLRHSAHPPAMTLQRKTGRLNHRPDAENHGKRQTLKHAE